MIEITAIKRVLLHRTRLGLLIGFALILTFAQLAFIPKSGDRTAVAATSSTLNFQARLLNASGSLVADGYYNIEFKLYNVASGGSALWTETLYDQNGATAGQDYRVRVVNGYFSVYLGDAANGGTAFPGTIDWDQELWLTMNVGGPAQTATPTFDGEMNPRLKLTAVPYAFKSAVSANVESADTNAASTNSNGVSITSGNAAGATSDSGDITIDVGTATQTTGELLFGTANASALTIGRAGVTTTLQGSVSLTGAGTALSVTNNAQIGGTLAVTSTSTFTGRLTANGGITIPSLGDAFINSGSTIYSATAISDVAGGGDIGSAATTVDVATTFNINQTTTGQTLTLPAPTTTTSGRVVFVNNVGSASFSMYGSVIATGKSNAFIWNGSAWVTTVSLSGSVVNVIGTLDGAPGGKTADGAAIDANAIYLQTADATYAGLVSATTQTFAGDKTFNGNLAVSGSATFTVGTGLTTLGGGLDVSAGNSTFAGNLVVESTGYLATNRAADFSTTGTTDDANLGNASLVRLTGASTQTLTGVAGGADGRILTIINAASQSATITNNDTNSVAANRVITGSGTDLTLAAGASISMIYDSGASVWRVTGSSVSTTGFANTSLSNLSSVSINQSLIANANNTLDLGAAGTAWRTVYAGTSVLTPSLDVSSAGTLSIGTSTATAITIGQTGITTTNAGALTVSELLTGSLGATISGATISLNDSSNFDTNINTGSSTGTVAIGNASSTTNVLGATNINTTGSAATSIGNSGATTTITASSLLFNTATISRTAAGTTTLDLVDGADTTLALLNSGAGVANLTVDGAVTASGLLTANGGLTVEAGDTFTFNGDAFTDLTGSGLTLVTGALTVDDSTATGFFRNGGNTFGGTATLGTNDAQSLVLETNNQSALTIASGGAATFQNATDSTSAFTVRGSNGVAYFAVDTSNGQIGTLPTTAAATNSQPVTLRSGQASGSGSNSGSIIIRSGNVNDGTVGNIQIETGSPTSGSNYGQIYIGSNYRNGGINIGTVGTDNRVSTVNIANTTGTSLQTVNIGSSGNTGNVTTILGGATGGVNIQTTGTGITTIGNASAGNITIQSGATIAVTGTTNINTSGSANSSIGNATGSLTLTGSSSSTFVLNGVTVDATEFNYLDGHDAALVDVNDAVNTAIIGTGALSSGSIASGFGTISTGNDITTTATVQGGTVNATSVIQLNGTDINTAGTLTNVAYENQANVFTLANTFQGNVIIENTGYLATERAADFSTTGTTNDANLGSASLVRLTGASTQTITGITGGVDGRILTIINAASQAASITNNDTNSSASNRIITGTGSSLALAAGASITLVYDGGDNLWRVTGSSSTSGGYANTSLSNLTSTSVNQSLIANANNTLDLGSSGTAWRTVYAGTSVLTPTIDTISAGTLAIGTTTATAITIGRTGITTTNAGALTVTELTTLNGGLAVETGDTFTFNGDAFTDLTGTGLTISTGALTVDTSYFNTNYIQNQNASDQTGNFRISGTGQANTSLLSPILDVASAGTLSIGSTTATAITIGQAGVTTTNAGALTVAQLLTGQLGATISGATISLNNSSNFNTSINGGTSNGTVTIGNSAAGAIGIQSASTIGVTGTTTITGLTSGVALTVSNSTSTGNIVNFNDDSTTVASIADGGAVTFQNSANSTSALRVLSQTGGSILNVDSTNSGNVTLFSGASGETSTWSNITGSSGVGLDDQSSLNPVYMNGYVYLVGGYNDAGETAVVQYAKVNADGTFGSWADTTSLPTSRDGAVVAVNGYVYMIGGIDGVRIDTVYYAKQNSDGTLGTWVQTSTLPDAFSETSATYHNGYIYIAGGYDGTSVLNTAYYAKVNADGSLGSWVTDGTIPAARGDHATVAANGYLYLVGGTQTNVYYAPLDENGNIGTWAQTNGVASRAYPGVVVANGRMYLIGGGPEPLAEDDVYYTTINSNGTLASWTTSSYLIPADRISAGAITINNYVYIIGGSNDNFATTENDVYRARLGSTLTVGGSLDLVGLFSGNLEDAGTMYGGSTGGSITAGNGIFVGDLQVAGNTLLSNDLSVYGTIQGGSTIALGSPSVAGSVVISDGSSNIATIISTNLTANRTYTLPDASGTFLLSASGTGNALVQVPISNTAGVLGANVIAPTAASIVGLTVNGTTSTAATALSVVQSGAAAAATIAQSANANGLVITTTNAAQTSASALSVTQSGTTTGFTGNLVSFTGSSTTGTGNLLNLTSVNTTNGNALNITSNSLTTGNAVNVNSTATGLTSGSLIRVSTATTGAVATNGIVSIQATGNYTSTSNTGLLNVLANSTTAGTIANISGTSLTSGIALNITAGSGIAINAAGTSTFTGPSSGSTSTLTINNSTSTGNVLSAQDNGTNVLVVADGGNLGVKTGTNSITSAYDITIGDGANRTIGVLTRTTNAAGNNLTISAGAAGAGASPFSGGIITIQGGNAAGTGNANGGNVALTGGTGTGTGVLGLVSLAPTYFLSSGTPQSFGTSGSVTGVDSFSTISINATAPSLTVTVPVPNATNQVVGRIIYITAASTSADFTLALANTSGSAPSYTQIGMKANNTATLVWNGFAWTAAGASSSTDLQSAYNNTLTSAGGAEIVLAANGGAVDGLTIRNNSSSPIIGGIFEVQSSIGTNLFSVNNLADEYAANGGAEDSTTFATNWTTKGTSTITRNTTSGQFATGIASVNVAAGTTAGNGVRQNLGTNPITNTVYMISFTARLASGSPAFTDLRVDYTPTGAASGTQCAASQTIVSSSWTRITCEVTTPGTAVTNPDVLIYQVAGPGSARTWYVDNFSMTLADDAGVIPNNVQIGGGIYGGAPVLFTLDRSSGPPVANGNETYLGSMYYDTVSGRIQCYESDGWGACGSAPNNYVNLVPEYPGSVLNGSGIGTMTANFCANQSTVLTVNTSFCANGESKNYYQWTSPQATMQTYSIYITYQLPAAFKNFDSDNSVTLTARTSSTTDGSVTYEMFRNEGGAISRCYDGVDTETTVTTTANTWQTVGINGNESTTCGFSTASADDFVIFKINVKARNNANVYASTLSFTTIGQ